LKGLARQKSARGSASYCRDIGGAVN
jgi:hypothetical protein